jgi:hypothetical protein
MNFEKAFIDSWKIVLEEREIESDIDFYKIKEKNKKLPVPKKKREKQNIKIAYIIKSVVFLFVVLNLLYFILRLLGLDIIKSYGDILFSLFERVNVLK